MATSRSSGPRVLGRAFLDTFVFWGVGGGGLEVFWGVFWWVFWEFRGVLGFGVLRVLGVLGCLGALGFRGFRALVNWWPGG